MGKTTPETETLKISEAKARLSSLVNEVHSQERRILIEKAGVPVAALISFEDLERLRRSEREWNERFAVVDSLREAFADLPPEQIERDISAIVREMRDEREAARRAAEQEATERRSA